MVLSLREGTVGAGGSGFRGVDARCEIRERLSRFDVR
jgi:hypothetical protein